jgi:hypothetical protein
MRPATDIIVTVHRLKFSRVECRGPARRPEHPFRVHFSSRRHSARCNCYRFHQLRQSTRDRHSVSGSCSPRPPSETSDTKSGGSPPREGSPPLAPARFAVRPIDINSLLPLVRRPRNTSDALTTQTTRTPGHASSCVDQLATSARLIQYRTQRRPMTRQCLATPTSSANGTRAALTLMGIWTAHARLGS